MSEVDLELAEIFTLLQQVGRVRVTQAMNMGSFLDAAGAQGQTESSLQRGPAHGFGGCGSPQSAMPFGREEQTWMAVDKPSLAAAIRHFLCHPEKPGELVSTPI